MGNKGKGLNVLPPPLGTPINYSNSISRGLVMACPFNENGGLITKDMVTGIVGTNSAINTRTARGFATTTTTGKVTFPAGFPKNIGDTNTSPFTVSLWLNRAGINNTNLFGWATTGSGGGAGWYCNMNAIGTGQLNFDYFDGIRFFRVRYTTTIPTNSWNHYVFTRDNTNAFFPAQTQKIFVNGVDGSSYISEGTSAPNTFSLSGMTFAIGARGSTGAICQGQITNFMMWNRVLTQNEIRTLYVQPFCVYK